MKDKKGTTDEKGLPSFAQHRRERNPEELVLPGEVKKKAENAWRVAVDAVRMANDNGVRIGAGTDSGGPCIPHNSLTSSRKRHIHEQG